MPNPGHDDTIDLTALLGAKRAHQDDQMASTMGEFARTMRSHHTALASAGFTDAQAFAMTMQLHRLWYAKAFGVPGQ